MWLHFCFNLLSFHLFYGSTYFLWQKFTHQHWQRKCRDLMYSRPWGINIFQPPRQIIWTNRHQKRCNHPRKRGKRARIRAKQLGRKAAPLPSLLLANVRSQENKMDEIRLRLTQQCVIWDCCAHIITETWLHHSFTDLVIALDRQTMFHTDRTQDEGRWTLCLRQWCLMLKANGQMSRF